MDLKFTIVNKELEDNLKDKLSELLYDYYQYVYGIDYFDAYLKISNNLVNSFNLEYAYNLKRVNQALNISLDNLLILVLDNNNELLGIGRLEKNNPKEAKLLDIVLINKDNNLFMKIVNFTECFLKKSHYLKMYLEIPLNSYYLVLADSLGFKEDAEDIIMNGNIKTQILNKDLK